VSAPIRARLNFGITARLPARATKIAPNAYEVTFTNFGDQKLIYKVRKTNAGWRITDIESPANKWTLIKLLSTK
jgi:hypothetical protein